MLEEFQVGKEFELVAFVQSLLDRELLVASLTPALIADVYTYCWQPGNFERYLMWMRGVS
jgi:hypothetical protein